MEAPHHTIGRQQQVQELSDCVKSGRAAIAAMIYLDGTNFHRAVPLNLEECSLLPPQMISLKFKPNDKDTFFCYGGGNLRSRIALNLVTFRKVGDQILPEQRIVGLADVFLNVKYPHYHLATANGFTRIKITTISQRQLKILEDDILKRPLAAHTARNLTHNMLHASHAYARKHAMNSRTVDSALRQSILSPTDIDIGAIQEITWHLDLNGLHQLVSSCLIPVAEAETDPAEIDDDDHYSSDEINDHDPSEEEGISTLPKHNVS